MLHNICHYPLPIKTLPCWLQNWCFQFEKHLALLISHNELPHWSKTGVFVSNTIWHYWQEYESGKSPHKGNEMEKNEKWDQNEKRILKIWYLKYKNKMLIIKLTLMFVSFQGCTFAIRFNWNETHLKCWTYVVTCWTS